tara:strand:- start:12136 stop:12390 length:255 start_codon:yes stop_codon:yes gene_type:complete
MKRDKIENKRLKLNADLNGCKSGQVIVIKCKNGVPIEKYWRDRIKDSATDNCVEVLTNRPQTSSSDKIAEKSEDNPNPKFKGKV